MAEMKFEEALKRLEKIVEELEDGSLSLDDSLDKYEEGIKLSKACAKKLEVARKKVEILLTIIQSDLGFLFLASMDFEFFEAAALFLLWLAQFLLPGIRGGIIWVYGAWALIESLRLLKNYKKKNAFRACLQLVRKHL